jgi:hypothetical protein
VKWLVALECGVTEQRFEQLEGGAGAVGQADGDGTVEDHG